MIKAFLICVLAVGTISAAPQFVTFKDGKIGVNFGGYTAEAGLGGLLTGNAAHGGLSASAGTPFGQRAAAGIGGLVNGDAAGRAYAGAQATDTIGASAVLGGSTGPNQRGIIGAEAHSNGNSVTKTITSDVNINANSPQESIELLVPTNLPKDRTVQRIKPPKKYAAPTGVENPSEFGEKTIETRFDLPASSQLPNSDVLVSPEETVVKTIRRHGLRRYKHHPAARHHVHLHKQVVYEPFLSQRFNGDEGQVKAVKTTYKTVERVKGPTLLASPEPAPVGQDGYQVVEKNVQLAPGGLSQFFNIPIGILQSIRDNLQPLNVRKQVTYTSSV